MMKYTVHDFITLPKDDFHEIENKAGKRQIKNVMVFLFCQKRACFKNNKNTTVISVTEIYFISSVKLWNGTTIFWLDLFGLFPEN